MKAGGLGEGQPGVIMTSGASLTDPTSGGTLRLLPLVGVGVGVAREGEGEGETRRGASLTVPMRGGTLCHLPRRVGAWAWN